MESTNVIRILKANNISYILHEYDNNLTNGQEIAAFLHVDESVVFKTLVTVCPNNQHFVFVIPVLATLDLKKAAKVANVKSLAMVKQKDLFFLTGYVHGGCSPIGMKKQFVTFIDETALLFDNIFVSAGKIGKNIEINPLELASFIKASFKDVIEGI